MVSLVALTPTAGMGEGKLTALRWPRQLPCLGKVDSSCRSRWGQDLA